MERAMGLEPTTFSLGRTMIAIPASLSLVRGYRDLPAVQVDACRTPPEHPVLVETVATYCRPARVQGTWEHPLHRRGKCQDPRL